MSRCRSVAWPRSPNVHVGRASPKLGAFENSPLGPSGERAGVSSPHAAVRHSATHSVTTATQPAGIRNQSTPPPLSVLLRNALIQRNTAVATVSFLH